MKAGDPDSHSEDRPSAAQTTAGASLEAVRAELAALQARCAELERENEALRREREQLARERDAARSRYGDLAGDASPARGAAPGTSAATDTAAQRATVLVVEDESLVRKAVQHYLAGAGYRVLTAADGMGALEQAAQHAGDIDLILTDLSLPGDSTGPEIAERIRKRRPGAAVLYMSASPPQHLARRGFSLQAAQMLEKPFSKEALLSRVATELAAGAARGDRACPGEDAP